MGTLSRKQLFRLSGILFLVAAVAFAFSPVKWMAALEAAAGLALLIASFRSPQPAPPARRPPPRRRGQP